MNCGAEPHGPDLQCLRADRRGPAQVILKRRLLNRTAFFLLGALAFLFSLTAVPPSEDSDGVLIFMGVLFF